MESDPTLFEEVSDEIGYEHHEDPYTDVNVQPLLPVLLSRQGPGIAWIDYDGDGDQDLLLSRAWDSILLLENQNGQFVDISSEAGLQEFKGWWNGVATGDFNKDGRPDIIAANIGSNSVYQPADGHPLKLYYSDFDMDGTLDIIDSYYNTELQAYVPRRKLYDFDSMPSVLGRINSHEQFARSSVAEITGQDVTTIPSKEINTVKHMLFINTEGGFEASPLPATAQFSAAFHAGIADFNSDGKEDLFLSQNNFAFPDNIPRQDAGRGLLLLGDGNGSFEAVEGQESGIRIYGQQRGAAVSDFNGDGRPDLAVTQNEGPVKLYRNRDSEPGIRIRLVGPPENREAIGSGMRVRYEDGSRGPLREVQAGTGYWSQHSTTPVMGMAGKAVALEVQWFDGETKTIEISAGADRGKEYVIHY